MENSILQHELKLIVNYILTLWKSHFSTLFHFYLHVGNDTTHSKNSSCNEINIENTISDDIQAIDEQKNPDDNIQNNDEQDIPEKSDNSNAQVHFLMTIRSSIFSWLKSTFFIQD